MAYRPKSGLEPFDCSAAIRFIKQLPAVAAKNHQGKWNGVNLVNLYAPASKNLEVGLNKERYFKCGDMDDLKEKIDYHLANPIRPDEKSIFRSRIEETYNWEKIAVQTIKVYEKALAK